MSIVETCYQLSSTKWTLLQRDKLHCRRSNKLLIGLPPSSDARPLYHRISWPLSAACFHRDSYVVCLSQAGILDLHKCLIGKYWTLKKLAVACQSQNTYSKFMQLDLATNIQHMPIHRNEPCPPVDIRLPTCANFCIMHFTHRSTPPFHSFRSAFYLPQSTFRSSAFYQQPSTSNLFAWIKRKNKQETVLQHDSVLQFLNLWLSCHKTFGSVTHRIWVTPAIFCESVCISVTCCFLLYIFIDSVCLYVLVCLCMPVWAMLPDSDKMMMIMLSWQHFYQG